MDERPPAFTNVAAQKRNKTNGKQREQTSEWVDTEAVKRGRL